MNIDIVNDAASLGGGGGGSPWPIRHNAAAFDLVLNTDGTIITDFSGSLVTYNIPTTYAAPRTRLLAISGGDASTPVTIATAIGTINGSTTLNIPGRAGEPNAVIMQWDGLDFYVIASTFLSSGSSGNLQTVTTAGDFTDVGLVVNDVNGTPAFTGQMLPVIGSAITWALTNNTLGTQLAAQVDAVQAYLRAYINKTVAKTVGFRADYLNDRCNLEWVIGGNTLNVRLPALTAGRTRNEPDLDGYYLIGDKLNYGVFSTPGQTVFNIPHGLSYTPTHATYSATTAASAAASYRSNLTGANLQITMLVPVVGVQLMGWDIIFGP